MSLRVLGRVTLKEILDMQNGPAPKESTSTSPVARVRRPQAFPIASRRMNDREGWQENPLIAERMTTTHHPKKAVKVGLRAENE